MRLNALGQDIAFLLEPWEDAPGPVDDNGVRTVTAISGVIVDLNLERPMLYEPNHLYVWPTSHTHRLSGAGNPPEETCHFAFMVLYVVDRLDEEAQVIVRRDVSDDLDERAHAYAAAVAAHRVRTRSGATAPWEMIESAVDYGATRTFGVRGVAVPVSGYRTAVYA